MSTSAVEEVKLLTLAEVLQALSVKRTSFHRLRASSSFPRPILVGKSMRWIPGEIREWQQEQRRIR
jgi:predicted DNA-binding transcriptional regulator AlpA